jgi:hypothetical protein
VAVLKYAAAVAVFFFVFLFLTALRGRLQGETEFSLHFGWLMLILIPGAPLFWLYGWLAAAWVLGSYAVVCILDGLTHRAWKRRQGFNDAATVLTPISGFQFFLYVGIIALAWHLTT